MPGSGGPLGVGQPGGDGDGAGEQLGGLLAQEQLARVGGEDALADPLQDVGGVLVVQGRRRPATGSGPRCCSRTMPCRCRTSTVEREWSEPGASRTTASGDAVVLRASNARSSAGSGPFVNSPWLA